MGIWVVKGCGFAASREMGRSQIGRVSQKQRARLRLVSDGCELVGGIEAGFGFGAVLVSRKAQGQSVTGQRGNELRAGGVVSAEPGLSQAKTGASMVRSQARRKAWFQVLPSVQ